MSTTPIPDDIMQMAMLVNGEIQNKRSYVSWSDAVMIIARAIMAERERCAKIAEGNYDHIGVKTKHDKCPHEKFGWEDCDQCAAAAI